MPTTYQNFNERFPGLEFDWFAVDATGNIGLFSTAGFGPVPIEVQTHFQEYDRVAAHIDWRVPEVWQESAKHGLFVFDWQHWEGPYLKMEQPVSEVEAAFKQQILQIPNLLVFDVIFSEVQSVEVEESEKD
jgi:hypothetical protein